MRKANRSPVKAILALVAGFFFASYFNPANSQQSVISNKDNTRPEMDQVTGSPVAINSFSANAFNGYNEVKWYIFSDQDIRKFTLEYSMNALDYQTAAEVIPSGKQYTIRHATTDRRPILYRIKTEQMDGAIRYSVPFFLAGETLSPVTVYPTVVSGNMININAGWPVERINIISSDGVQVFSKEISGQKDFIPLAIPRLSKGMYWVAFYGNGWKTTQKILVS